MFSTIPIHFYPGHSESEGGLENQNVSMARAPIVIFIIFFFFLPYFLSLALYTGFFILNIKYPAGGYHSWSPQKEKQRHNMKRLKPCFTLYGVLIMNL
jgi:hypothetical protein